MLVRFKLNLGANDANVLKLDFKECKCGAEVDVAASVGEVLVSHGWAEVVQAEAAPEKVKAVAKAPAIVGVKEDAKKGDDK